MLPKTIDFILQKADNEKINPPNRCRKILPNKVNVGSTSIHIKGRMETNFGSLPTTETCSPSLLLLLI